MWGGKRLPVACVERIRFKNRTVCFTHLKRLPKPNCVRFLPDTISYLYEYCLKFRKWLIVASTWKAQQKNVSGSFGRPQETGLRATMPGGGGLGSRLLRLGPTAAKVYRLAGHLRGPNHFSYTNVVIQVASDPDLARLAGVELVHGPCSCDLQSSRIQLGLADGFSALLQRTRRVKS